MGLDRSEGAAASRADGAAGSRRGARQLRLPHIRPGRLARPFLKWAGGKTYLLPELYRRLPERFGRYVEPFVGGGALFFALQPERAALSDLNADLMQLYAVVRDAVDSLIAALGQHVYERDHYYAVRALDPAALAPVERAARMLYLNRTCFNGLYRVNRSGQFNVPFGRYRRPVICQTDRLRAASEALQGRELTRCPFEEAVSDCAAGDLVYFDPPYHPRSETSNFTAYTGVRFGASDQRALAAVFRSLSDRGVFCLLSNSDTPLVRELYADFPLDVVRAPRRISRDGGRRGLVTEVLVRSG